VRATKEVLKLDLIDEKDTKKETEKSILVLKNHLLHTQELLLKYGQSKPLDEDKK
jgi:hypothetical protein